MNFKYYTIARPPMPGAIPKEGLIEVECFDNRTKVDDCDRPVWGVAIYGRRLTEEEIAEYELKAVGDDETPEMFDIDLTESEIYMIIRALNRKKLDFKKISEENSSKITRSHAEYRFNEHVSLIAKFRKALDKEEA